uniref:TLDc domain-containing protein n=1 Tax=Hucho hucho TaxID=62062 RepID=A0A4W5RG54_9TELE
MAHAAVSALDLGREKQLLQFFPEPVRLQLLYKAPHHGFKMSDLISKFDQVGRFVVIVYLESGTMKGGYLSKRPESYCQEDRGAFVFEIDHQKANVFPVVKHRNAIILNKESFGFGDCLTIYSNKDKTLCVAVGFDDTYTPTDWSEELEVPFMDVELHRIQKRGSLRKNVVSFKPACRSINRVRVLLMGPPGSGKSSFINSVRSVMFGRVLLLPFIVTFVTDREIGGKPTAVTLCDVLALGDEAFLKLKYTTSLHFLLCRNILSSKRVIKLRSYIYMTLCPSDIPQVVLLTHVDQVCHAIQEDVKFVYSSRILQEKVGLLQKLKIRSEVVGLPVSYVFPVKNYSSELSVSCNTDILLLSAVHHILQTVDDTFEDYCPPTPADASPVTV